MSESYKQKGLYCLATAVKNYIFHLTVSTAARVLKEAHVYVHNEANWYTKILTKLFNLCDGILTRDAPIMLA